MLQETNREQGNLPITRRKRWVKNPVKSVGELKRGDVINTRLHNKEGDIIGVYKSEIIDIELLTELTEYRNPDDTVEYVRVVKEPRAYRIEYKIIEGERQGMKNAVRGIPQSGIIDTYTKQ